jgi:hypothetical protein
MEYPHPRFEALWKYDNKMVLREFILDEEVDGSKYKATAVALRKFYQYLFFVLRDNGEYELIVASSEFQTGLYDAVEVWDPPKEKTKKADQSSFLTHIEKMLWSMVKKGKQEQIKQFDFAVGYHDGMLWRAFYPTLKTLIEHHKTTAVEQNQEYLNYLQSDDLKKVREEWEKTPGVEFPNQQ